MGQGLGCTNLRLERAWKVENELRSKDGSTDPGVFCLLDEKRTMQLTTRDRDPVYDKHFEVKRSRIEDIQDI